MDNLEPAHLHVEVSASDATEEDIDRMTRQLLAELRQTDVESAELAKGEPAPGGAKGDPITIGSISMQILPAAIPGVIALVQAWITRGQGRTVKFKGKVGRDMVEFEGPPEELGKLLEALQKGKKK